MAENKDYRRRDYKHEYEAYQGKPEQIHNRALRNKARREMTEKLGKAALEGKDIDHTKQLDKGGSNEPTNWRVSTVRANRNWRKGKHGY